MKASSEPALSLKVVEEPAAASDEQITYDDLEKYSRVDPGAIEALSKENPTLANVLIDYFELHKFGKMNMYMHVHSYICSYIYVSIYVS